jgi:hypothetical protein
MDKFLSELNSESTFSGSIKYTINNSAIVRSCSYSTKATFKAHMEKSTGYLILMADLPKTEKISLYQGNATTTSITSVTVTMTKVGVDGFLLGQVSNTERTTDTDTIVCSGGATSGGGTGSGASSASVASINEDGIDTADYTIGSFDDF